jgi:hypothetical protein
MRVPFVCLGGHQEHGQGCPAGLLAGNPVNFAFNTLTIVVAPGNPTKIASFKDLAQPGLSVVVVCAPQVRSVRPPRRSNKPPVCTSTQSAKSPK